MNFKIYIVGDKINKFYKEAIKEYEKRLSHYCKIKLISVKSENELAKKAFDKAYKITINENAYLISSEELANKINNFAIDGISDISIIIGAKSIEYNESLTISPMEMDLGLKGTIIFEQIYRAYRIINNQAYHK
ncbi:MAG: rRNA methyltransferase [Clostridiaceae bacterium]|jgi:23S rRNA (pseudouridine1915-N3)-methyltransferase|nr:rRNA methyltransferase [Clostridiaceae bacterium]